MTLLRQLPPSKGRVQRANLTGWEALKRGQRSVATKAASIARKTRAPSTWVSMLASHISDHTTILL